MGIPRLTTRLQHKAVREEWPNSSDDASEDHVITPKIAIIDGPGLAYYIFGLHVQALASAGCGARFATDYDAISRRLHAFLSSLENRGFDVQRIYFDGVLPAAKIPVRTSRLNGRIQEAVHLRALCERQTKQQGRDASSPAAYLKACSRPATCPAPPFLVSAVINGLAQSKFAHATFVVPSEADHECVSAAMQSTKPETYIFTNDSDLLVLQSGVDTKIVMLSSLAETSDGILQADVWQPAKLTAVIAPASLLEVAYLMKYDRHITLESAAERLRRSDINQFPGYDSFLAELQGESVSVAKFSTQQQLLLRYMDPRLSELILRIPEQAQSHPAAPPAIWLGYLNDDSNKASAWRAGTNIRRLGYTVLAQGSTCRAVHEWDRRGDVATSSVVNHDESLASMLEMYITWLSEQLANTQAAGLFQTWRVIAMITLINDLRSQGKSAPADTDLSSVMHGRIPRSWSQIHLDAQVQAVLYSYRILHSCLDFMLAATSGVESECQQLMQQLVKQLVSLPSIKYLFDPVDDGFEAQCTALISKHCTQANAAPPRRRKNKIKPVTIQPAVGKVSEALSNNPFAMLAE